MERKSINMSSDKKKLAQEMPGSTDFEEILLTDERRLPEDEEQDIIVGVNNAEIEQENKNETEKVNLNETEKVNKNETEKQPKESAIQTTTIDTEKEDFDPFLFTWVGCLVLGIIMLSLYAFII